MSEDNYDIDVSINEDGPKPLAREIQTGITERPEDVLNKIAGWATNGTDLNLSSKDGLRHLLAESRDRSSMFMSVLSLQRMKRVANLVGIAEDIQENLFRPERLAMMETAELLAALKSVEAIVKENIDFIGKASEDATTGAQILINMVDARSLTLGREDVPSAKSRESIRHAVSGLLEAFGAPAQEDAFEDTIDTEVIDVNERTDT